MIKNLVVEKAISEFNEDYRYACINASREYYDFDYINDLYNHLYEVYEETYIWMDKKGIDLHSYTIACQYMVRKIAVFFNCYYMKYDDFLININNERG